MFKNLIKNLSILKKFLFINFLLFLVIGTLTYIYLRSVQPNLIKNKSVIEKIIDEIIRNTTSHIQRLNIKFNTDDIRKFLFSTRFLFQNLDRVILFNKNFKKLGDTDTLDLDPRSFSQRLEIIDTSQGIKNENQSENKNSNNKKEKSIFKILETYANSKEFGKPFTFTQESYDNFNLTTIKNINIEGSTIGYIAITENANDIKVAINERKNFIIRTAILVAIVIIIFSFVLNRFFLKPIRNLVSYTNIIKDKSKEKTNIENIKNRNDELGVLSKSMDEMTKELQYRTNRAESFSN